MDIFGSTQWYEWINIFNIYMNKYNKYITMMWCGPLKMDLRATYATNCFLLTATVWFINIKYDQWIVVAVYRSVCVWACLLIENELLQLTGEGDYGSFTGLTTAVCSEFLLPWPTDKIYDNDVSQLGWRVCSSHGSATGIRTGRFRISSANSKIYRYRPMWQISNLLELVIWPTTACIYQMWWSI